MQNVSGKIEMFLWFAEYNLEHYIS